jgi:hypothetical protein
MKFLDLKKHLVKYCLCITEEYVGVLISLWLFLFSYFQHNQKNFSEWVKEVGITKA